MDKKKRAQLRRQKANAARRPKIGSLMRIMGRVHMCVSATPGRFPVYIDVEDHPGWDAAAKDAGLLRGLFVDSPSDPF